MRTAPGGVMRCTASRSSPAPGAPGCARNPSGGPFGHLCAAPHLGAAPVPGAPSCARTRSGGPFGHPCAPHLEAPHDPRRRLETVERRGSSCTTAQPAPRSRRPGRWRALVEFPYDIPDISLTNAFGPRVGPALAPAQRTLAQASLRRGVGQGHCVEMWGRGPLRRGVGQRAVASGCGAGVLRRNVGARHRGPRLPFDSLVALAGRPGWGCAGCVTARVELRLAWAELGVGLGWVRGWAGCGAGGAGREVGRSAAVGRPRRIRRHHRRPATCQRIAVPTA